MADRFLDDLEFTGDRKIPENYRFDHVYYQDSARNGAGSRQ
jgi:hypothetical protein